MKNYFLIPGYYSIVGWITFLVFAALGISQIEIPGFQFYYPADLGGFSNMGSDYNLTNELCLTGAVIGLLMVCFARHKNEDEYITQLRLSSWQWSVFVSYLVLIIINFSFYGLIFYSILSFNVFTILLVFIGKFYYSIFKLNRSIKLETK